MLTRIQTTQRNALRALSQWEARICAEDDQSNASVLVMMQHDCTMDAFNEARQGECYGMYANEGNE